ncbi:alpha/beta hydrolase [Myxococcus stipitatus]|uniref:alpha/beta hydrolase n=1 Tax=Myxococcus stipitatus TaxID=83455 RepID=UPI0031452DA6
MFLGIGVLAGITLLVLGLRQWLLHREGPACPAEPFDGHVYRVGKALIAERSCAQPRATVICMHGFVSDLRYFTRHYEAADLQLILVTSCDYHPPIAQPAERPAPWARVPTEPEGTIPHDAAVLVQALEDLPRTEHIRVHGHSRGGAVVLEAARQRPDLFERVEVVLEAPVLPQGRPYAKPNNALLWLMPFGILLWRLAPISRHTRYMWGPLENARKRELIRAFPFNPKRVSTLVTNARDIEAWIQERDASLFQNVRRGTVLVPGQDRVLDSVSMLESARRAEPTLDVVTLEECSHFILWDRPDAFPELVSPRERTVANG